MILDTLETLLRYPLSKLFINRDEMVDDLHQLNLLSENEVYIIKTMDKYHHHIMAAIMASDTIISGGKNDFSKLTIYLKSFTTIKYVAQYWEKICELSLVDTENLK